MEQFDILSIGQTKIYNFAQVEDINIKNTFFTVFKELYSPLLYDNYFLYEDEQIQIDKDDIVVDCGGNFGLFAAWAASKCKFVYSFEPSKINFPFLSKMASLYPNIKIEPLALNNINDNLEFSDCYFSAGSHLSQFNINQSCIIKNKYLIAAITLDSYFKNEKVDFIKIDVEGSEYLVLQGAKNILQYQAPKLSIACYHENETINDIKTLIQSINPKYSFKEKGDLLFAWIN